MAWVEVETDTGPWVFVAGAIGLAAAAAVWWSQDICAGAIAYCGAAFAVLLARQLWLQAWLPKDARHAAGRVLAWFREQHPGDRVWGVAVRAVEPERFVISVRYGDGKPPRRGYFAVTRLGPGTITVLPPAGWRPRGLK